MKLLPNVLLTHTTHSHTMLLSSPRSLVYRVWSRMDCWPSLWKLLLL